MFICYVYMLGIVKGLSTKAEVDLSEWKLEVKGQR